MIAHMLAARRFLRRVNPDLLLWCDSQWQTWLRGQRSRPEPPDGRRLQIFAAVTCLEDLPLHVGLMQLLLVPELRCSLVLSLPTEELAQLVRAQARRDEWQMLVHIIVETDCAALLGNLPPDEVLAVFLYPAVLSAHSLESVVTSAKLAVLGEYEGFVGRAGDYAAWLDAQESTTSDHRLAVFKCMPSVDPTQLVSVPKRGGSSGAGREVKRRATIAVRSEGTVEVPALADGSEVVVTALPDSDDAAVVVRQRIGLCSSNGRVRVRAPTRMLTTMAQKIRLEYDMTDGKPAAADLLFHVPPSHLKPWMISAFLNRGGAGNPVIRAFAEGIGCRIAYAEDEPSILRDIPVVWGILRDSGRIVAQAKAQAFHFFYVDHAYFDRGHGKSYRITRNAYEAGPIRRCPTDRMDSLALDIAPWRKGGREIIVCPPTEYFMRAHGCMDWLETTLATLRKVSDRPIVVREKPKPEESLVPLPRALETAHALVTHSSNVAIEAACLGTPVFVAPASAAAPIGCTELTEIENPVFPDRAAWLAHLAYNQFSFDEIRDGGAWRMLLELETRELA